MNSTAKHRKPWTYDRFREDMLRASLRPTGVRVDRAGVVR